MTGRLILLLMSMPVMATMYTGSLSSSDGGLTGVGAWVDPEPSEIHWEITLNDDNSWHYEYVLIVPDTESEISHFILETSPTFTGDDILNSDGGFSGFGDGNCPDFNSEIIKTLIWKDQRK